MKRLYSLLYTLVSMIVMGCNGGDQSSSSGSSGGSSSSSSANCRGVYYYTDSLGNLKKYNQYNYNGACVTDQLPLSQWENTSQIRTQRGISCVPQPTSTKTLISANNFYSERDGKVYLSLNASTGEYRKLIITNDKNGKQVFTRLLGCFYVKYDPTYGNQLLFDNDYAASSDTFNPMEIFTYTETLTTFNTVRFDDSYDWDYRFCPFSDTPWGFCDPLRDGNQMYYPTLSTSQQSSLLNDAILIRKQFNYASISQLQFETMWNTVQNSASEATRDDFKYAVEHIVDTPRYIDQAWEDFIKGNRPTMPDINSVRVPPLCYNGRQSTPLTGGGTGYVSGQICYVNGSYTFITF